MTLGTSIERTLTRRDLPVKKHTFARGSAGACAIIVLMVSLIAPGAPAQLAVDFTGGSQAPGGGFTLGWEFSLSTSMGVDALGIWDENPNGLIGPHAVGLWNTTTGLLLASATINNGPVPVASLSPDGRWLFTSINLLVLGPGDYTLGAAYDTTLSNDPARYNTSASYAPGITFLGDRQASGSSLHMPTTPAGLGNAIFGPNMHLIAVPEPTSLALLLGVGVGAGIFELRRRQR